MSTSSSTPVLCPVCVDRALRSQLDRHHMALQETAEAKQECARRLVELRSGSEESPFNLSELVQESQVLKDRLGFLRQECGSLAVKVAAQVVKNDERQVGRTEPSAPRQKLHRLYQALCDPVDGALTNSIVHTTGLVRVARYQWAVQAFTIHRLDVGLENHDDDNRNPNRRPKGIGKIGGLPLPHAGPELYGVLPPQELISALRLVASLTCTVARCLGIDLPHPILLRPPGMNGKNRNDDLCDIVHTVKVETKEKKDHMTGRQEEKQQPVGSSSTASLMTLVGATSAWGRSAKNALLARATGALEEDVTAMPPPSMEPALVNRRLLHATCVVLSEDSKSSSLYTLSKETMLDDQFAIGLQFLQNNVVALCIRSGVPVDNLWPAEALLLNLYALWLHCQDQIVEIVYGTTGGQEKESRK